MTMTTLHPQTFFETLASSAKGLKLKNINILQRVCVAHYESKALDFSLATVGRLSEAAGGISKKAIYNPTSVDYKALANVWAAFAASTRGAPLAKVPPLAEESLLMQIPDPAIRALVGAAVAERNRLRSELNVLKGATSIIVDRRTTAGIAPLAVVGGSEIFAPMPTLTDTEKRALEKAISRASLDCEGWAEGAHGEIRNSRGRSVFEPGFTTAIRKLLTMTANVA